MQLHFIDKESQKGVTGPCEKAACVSVEQWERKTGCWSHCLYNRRYTKISHNTVLWSPLKPEERHYDSEDTLGTNLPQEHRGKRTSWQRFPHKHSNNMSSETHKWMLCTEFNTSWDMNPNQQSLRSISSCRESTQFRLTLKEFFEWTLDLEYCLSPSTRNVKVRIFVCQFMFWKTTVF